MPLPAARAALKATSLAKEAWRVTKQRILAQCHEIVFGQLKKLSHTGFTCECADGQTRKVFPALHSYIADTPEHHKLACVLNWPAGCYCCDMPRAQAARSLDDLTRGGAWPFRTVAELEELQRQADRAGDTAAARSPNDPQARLRAATKFCDDRGIRWGPTVLRCAVAAPRTRPPSHRVRPVVLPHAAGPGLTRGLARSPPSRQRLAAERRRARQPFPGPPPRPAAPRGQRRVAHVHRRLLRRAEGAVPHDPPEARPRG